MYRGLTTSPRVGPLAPPFAPELQAVFDKIMPAGVPPLALFTTLARVPRIYDRFRAGSLLDRGPVSLRHREIVIQRTCARCGCAYEWGVHAAFFADRAALTPEQVRATVRGVAKDAAWSEEETLLIRLVDELHAARRQQRFHALAQWSVARAGLLQKRRALLLGQLDSRIKDRTG